MTRILDFLLHTPPARCYSVPDVYGGEMTVTPGQIDTNALWVFSAGQSLAWAVADARETDRNLLLRLAVEGDSDRWLVRAYTTDATTLGGPLTGRDILGEEQFPHAAWQRDNMVEWLELVPVDLIGVRLADYEALAPCLQRYDVAAHFLPQQVSAA